MSVLDPVSVILVTAGSRGEKLLFRYPFCQENDTETNGSKSSSETDETKSENPIQSFAFAKMACLNYSDKTLANILTPREKLCGKKFELRIEDVLFVGHPTLVRQETKQQKNHSKVEGINIKLFNIVFALQAEVDLSVSECYYDLSRKLSTALKHEELRCGYFCSERQTMLAIHDEVSEQPEASEASPFHLILPKSTLAQALCETFHSVSQTGAVNLKINNWIRVGFCLPHKVHNINPEMVIKPETIEACLAAMRPYHGILLLVEDTTLLSLLPDDCSPDLIRFIKMTTPLKSFQTLSQDTDISLSLIFSIAAHLVYWGKARIIYPLCESNVYVVSPDAFICFNSQITEQFAAEYSGMSLQEQLSQFSLPTPLGEQASPLWSPQQKTNQVQRVIWMLKHHLLIQLIRGHSFEQRERVHTPTLSTTFPTFSTNNVNKVALYTCALPKLRIALTTFKEFINQSGFIYFYLSNGIFTELNTCSHWIMNVLLRSKLHMYIYLIPNKRSDISASSEDHKLFARLTRYFCGNHHLEEIMYYENLRRNQLLTLLEKFRQVLFICQHEDPATVYLVISS